MEKLYTVSEIAEKLDLSLQSIYRIIERREITFLCLGKKSYRIPESALEEYIARKTSEVA